MRTATSLTVGASLSLSGRFAAQGRQAQHGLTLWVEDVNRGGGLMVEAGHPRRPVHLIVHDDASRRAEAAAHTRRLLMTDHVDLLFGPYSSVLALAAAEVAAEHDRTLWNHGGSSDAMLGQGWRHVINLLSPASSYFVPLLDMAVRATSRPIHTVAFVHGARGTFPAAVIDGAEAHARALGLAVVLRATYPEETPLRQPARETSPPQPPSPRRRGGSDALRVLVREIGKQSPDLILGVGTTEADVAFARELRAQGLRPALIGLVAAAVQPFRDALGADADGICGPSQWEPTLHDQPEIGPASAEFAAAFQARFGMMPDYPAAQAYAAGLIAAHSVERAGSLDDHAIRAVASVLDTSTFYGRFRTDARSCQQSGHQIVVVQWQAGRKEIVWPPAAAASRLAAPAPGPFPS